MKKTMRTLGAKTRRERDAIGERRARLVGRVPYLATVRAPAEPFGSEGPNGVLEVATYNVHRWTGPRGGKRWTPELAMDVISELDAHVIALQEVLRPFEVEDPLPRLADALGLTWRSCRRACTATASSATRSCRAGRSPPFTLDLSFRGSSAARDRRAVRARREPGRQPHLALVDRTRRRQVHELLDHPQLQGPTVLLGDMNAWRRCPATRRLEDELTQLHHNEAWPATWPAARPVLALDRVYARGARVARVRVHQSAAARRASDHLPVVATVDLKNGG
jgi:endonuclease/exonuclease/phosphatase family metal-dependent hydrolase